MILRCFQLRGGWTWVFALFMVVAWTEGSAVERSRLSAVTPSTLALGEEAIIRWSYDDGNGGKKDSLFNSVNIIVLYRSGRLYSIRALVYD